MGRRLNLTTKQVQAVRRLWKAGATDREICSSVGISIDLLKSRRGDQLRDLPARHRRVNSGRRGADPSPEQIEAACLAYRSKWSQEEMEAHR